MAKRKPARRKRERDWRSAAPHSGPHRGGATRRKPPSSGNSPRTATGSAVFQSHQIDEPPLGIIRRLKIALRRVQAGICPSMSCTSRNEAPTSVALRAAWVANVRRPECEE
jgi:hypothetical protein